MFQSHFLRFTFQPTIFIILIFVFFLPSFITEKVAEKLKLGAKTAIDIDKLRDGYRPAAKLGAVLFFVLAEMSSINSMYQYSLNSYLEVFDLSLRKSLPDSILVKRLKNIMDTLTINVYNYACTGMKIFLCVYLIYYICLLYILSYFFRITSLVTSISLDHFGSSHHFLPHCCSF